MDRGATWICPDEAYEQDCACLMLTGSHNFRNLSVCMDSEQTLVGFYSLNLPGPAEIQDVQS